MFTGPVGPIKVFFYWPKDVYGNVYWPRASGSLLASSPDLGLGSGFHQVLQSK